MPSGGGGVLPAGETDDFNYTINISDNALNDDWRFFVLNSVEQLGQSGFSFVNFRLRHNLAFRFGYLSG
ncbi:MAG: hypothetical protein LBS77_02575 [Desulfovibrio sp.]|nr:hypothetical protein [Desulfovibrio sp.]